MTKFELDKLLSTLPIGYYAKREIGITSDEIEETSYYDPESDSIVISLRIINEGLKSISLNNESAVRSMLYHEVSHAILTPNRATKCYWSDVMNVFEDERIETVLKDFYFDVDFKKQVFAINGINSPADIRKPKDGWEYFYNVVRFRHGDTEDLETVNALIKKYASIANNHDGYREWYSYYREITDFYRHCCKKYGKPKEDHNIARNAKTSDNQANGKPKNGNAKPQECNDNGNETENTSVNTAKSEQSKADSAISKVFGRKGGDSSLGSPFDNIDNYVDINLTDTIKDIFRAFNSRQLNNGNAMNGYSGIFDPRSVIRDDYKYFIRQNAKGNGKGFSKFNLNLFIDCSGSYCYNVVKTNTIINSLQEIEKENPMFSFTVTCMEVGEWRLPQEKRYIRAMGGNKLDKKLFDLFREVQRGDAVNYNIVLFDGWTEGGENFAAFDYNNVTIISDSDNSDCIKKYASSARKKFVSYEDANSESYADRLYDNILEVLKVAFL